MIVSPLCVIAFIYYNPIPKPADVLK